MSEFKLPHVEDLTTNSKLPGQLTENFKRIEQEDKDDDQALSDEVIDRKKGDEGLQGEIDSEEQDRKSEDDKLNGRINDTNTRLDNLDKQKATHNEVKAAKDEWKKKIEHVALGTDYETVEQAVMQILKEKGMI